MSERPVHIRVMPVGAVDASAATPVVLRSSSLAMSLPWSPEETPPALDHLLFPDDEFNPHWRDGLIDQLRSLASGETVIYAVGGEPVNGDVTVQYLLSRKNPDDIRVTVERSSTLTPLELAVTGFSAPAIYVDCISLLEAQAASPFAGGSFPLSSNQTTIVTNLVAPAIAPVRRVIERHFGADVELFHAASDGTVAPEPTSLTSLDESRVETPSCLIVPAATGDRFYRSPDDLQRLVARLRAPGGCPWDQKQTNESLTRNLIEESYELLEAIDSGEVSEIREEMGDFLLQAYLHCQIAEEAGRFTLEDVLSTLITKLVRRHPHVFASVDAEDADHVVRNWDEIKRSERAGKPEGANGGPLGNVPVSLPALARAQTLLKRSRRMDLDAGLIDHRRAEAIARASKSAGDADAISQLLAAIERAAEQGIDAEESLRRWTREFEHAFEATAAPADDVPRS